MREIILGKKNFKNFNNNMNVVKTYNIYIQMYTINQFGWPVTKWLSY